MSVQKFLELDSNYRDRNRYPYPASFECEISQSGTRGQINAIDPISYAYPQMVFCPDDITSLTFNYNIASGGGAGGLIAASSSNILVLSLASSAGFLPTTPGYLVGASLKLGDELRRIVEWSFLQYNDFSPMPPSIPITYTQYFLVTIEAPFIELVSGDTLEIFSPTDLTNQATAYMFIPNTLSIPNYYNKYLVYNESLNTYASILSFNKDTHLALLSNITGLNWSKTHFYSIREQIPRNIGNVGNLSTLNNIVLSNITVLDSTYINNFLMVYPKVVFTAQRQPESYQISKIIGFVPNTNIAIISPGYLGSYSATGAYGANDWGSYPGSLGTYRYEVLGFNIDNVSPFVFTGTMSSQSQAVAQAVTLNSLILPNATLYDGGRIAYYPYVYVELENTSSSSGGNRNLIYSNNPHTYKALFKVPITDLNYPNQSPFVKLTGNGMKQTIVFKQNDDMKVSIKLPNGDLFKTSSSDTSPGNLPNPLLQISVLFGIEKIS